MPTPSVIKQQINTLILHLVGTGFANDQQFGFQRSKAGNKVEITFPGAEHVSVAMRNRSYTEIYDHLARERAYNVKMMDGAMVQMMYIYDGSNLERHRLAFLPSPHLEEFQNNPEIYLEDEIYADIVAKNCRIPVSSPLTPFHFMQFILRNFYHTAHERYADKLPCFNHAFEETIMADEKRVIYIQVPQGERIPELPPELLIRRINIQD